MTPTEYQIQAQRTDPHTTTEQMLDRITALDQDIDPIQLINACLGLAGEVGEFSELAKKFLFHGSDYDRYHARKELGDICWYIAQAAEALHLSLDDVMQANIDKLRARYPEGFDTYRANHRAAGDI